MSTLEIAQRKISDGIRTIFTPEVFPSFLSFSKNFVNFDYKNIILIYLQDPQASHIAGLNAWKHLTGLNIKKNAVPILILYPYLKDNKIGYTIQKMFDYRQLDNENITKDSFSKYKKTCKKKLLFEGLKGILKEQGYSVYPDSNLSEKVSFTKGIITVKASLTEEEKFVEVLKLYFEQETNKQSFLPLIKGAITNTSIYLIHSYYELDVSHVSFPYLKLPISPTDKETILKESFNLSSKIIEKLNNYSTEAAKEKSVISR